MNPIVQEFYLALLLRSSMACSVGEAWGHVHIEFDGFVEAERFEAALKQVVTSLEDFDTEHKGRLVTEMLTLRLDQYETAKIELPDLGLEHEAGQAVRWRIFWRMPRAAIANDLFIRLNWLLDKTLFMV